MVALGLTLFVAAFGVIVLAQSGNPSAKRGGRTVREWIQVLEEDDEVTRYRALQALTELGPTAHAALPRLWETSKSQDHGVKRRALRAIMSISTAPEEHRAAGRELDRLDEERDLPRELG